MKIFTAVFGTETNTFSPFLTGMPNFAQTYLVHRGEHPLPPSAFAVPAVRWRELAHARGWETVESLGAFAMPAGKTLQWVYEELRDEILRDLKNNMPVDAVLVNMHGAMVSEECDDCEGDTVAHIRAIVGPDVPIGVELDLHCHLSQQLIDKADAVITYKEYPHIDTSQRAEELFNIIVDTAAGAIKPHIAMHDLNMIGVYHTTREPVKSFVQKMTELEGKEGVLSVSLGHGFPWGDVADLGTRILVITDNDPAKGASVGKALGDEFYAMRASVQPRFATIDDALDQALAPAQGPVVLADVSDNAGGGAPNDSTFILRRLLERNIGNAAIGCIWDPIVVETAMEVGEGVELELRIGGKMGPMSGDPVDLRVRVGKIARAATQRFGDGTNHLGDTVALHGPNGIDIVAITHRSQTFSPEVFTNVGIDPTAKQILVVKSMQHFYAGFEPIAAHVIYVAAPGALVPDFSLLPYTKARRTIWPISA